MKEEVADARIKVGISTCLLGEKVRHDGGHKLDRYLVDTLGRHVEFVPVCPEMECGLGVPRESMRLVGDPESPRLVTTRTRRDMTDRMLSWARKRIRELEKADLCGFVFKSNSPSSGMVRVRVYGESGVPVRKGAGIFARVFMKRFPLVPVEDDGRLHDSAIRENFIERVFAFRRWKDLAAGRKSRGDLVRFHAEHKLLIMAHSEKHLREMGKLVAQVKRYATGEVYGRYQTLLMDALSLKATVRKNCNVLMHMLGYFKEDLSADEKQELLEVTEQYRHGYVPLIVPITLFNHYVRKFNQPYLSSQYYLSPHPVELALRNHV